MIRGTHLALLLSLAVTLTVQYFRVVEDPRAERRLAFHAGMIDHTQPSQYRHRVLAPYAAEALARCIAVVLPGPQRFRPEDRGSFRALLSAYILINAVSFSAALICLYALLRNWFSEHWALTGCLIMAVSLPLTYYYTLYHPWSQIEMALFCWGLLLMEKGRYRWLTAIIVLAAFNRETSLFLVIAFFFVAWNDRKKLLICAGYFGIWLAVFMGLRVGLGFPPPTFTARMAWEGNISAERWPHTIVLNLALFGAFWVYIVRGMRLAPRLIRRAVLMAPLYIGLLLVLGFWNEVRYWMPVYPILIPAGLVYLRSRSEPAGVRSGDEAPLL